MSRIKLKERFVGKTTVAFSFELGYENLKFDERMQEKVMMIKQNDENLNLVKYREENSWINEDLEGEVAIDR